MFMIHAGMAKTKSCLHYFFVALTIGINATFGIQYAIADDPVTRAQSRAAMLRAARFFSDTVSARGGYLYRYSSDLTYREGEEIAQAMTAWIQPPGTPSVGEAYLHAYQLTHEPDLLADARQTAAALVQGQLESGGWDSLMELGGETRGQYAYRTNAQDTRAPRRRNATTLDDNKTQSALRFLMNLDRELHFKDEAIHECDLYALDHILDAQYPNGAWPQRFSQPPQAGAFPVIPANYPPSWSREYPNTRYAGFYTFNDNAIGDMIDVMFRAYWVYGDERYRDSAVKAGDFILLAQMPDPQPAWAQQYNQQMQPAWARKFEPPAVSGGESQGVLSALLNVFEYSGEKRFLAPVERALKFLESSTLEDGRLARFYELNSNRPLFFTKDYQLTYDDSDVPTHYAFKVDSRLPKLRQRYTALVGEADNYSVTPPPLAAKPVAAGENLTRRASNVVAGMDARGAWVEIGRMQQTGAALLDVIQSRTFARNLVVLAQHASAQ